MVQSKEPQDQELVRSIKKDIEENDVFVYSKSYCPYCMRAKQTLDQMGVKYTVKELDLMPNGEGLQIQQTLAEHVTGVRTVPQIFFKNHFWGGSDKTVQGYHSGELQKHLRSLGIAFTEQKAEL